METALMAAIDKHCSEKFENLEKIFNDKLVAVHEKISAKKTHIGVPQPEEEAGANRLLTASLMQGQVFLEGEGCESRTQCAAGRADNKRPKREETPPSLGSCKQRWKF